MALRIELYSRVGCHLCEEALAVLLAARERFPFELVERDLGEVPALLERYRYRIPVVVIAGRERFEHRVDPAALLAILEAEGA